MERVFNIDKKLKKKYLKEWAKTQEGYKWRSCIYVILKALSAIIFLGLLLPFTCLTYGTDSFLVGMLSGLGTGAVFGFIPFVIGQSVGIKAVEKCGTPFSNRTNESILVADEGIEFRYHNKNMPDGYDTSMDVYQIVREDVRVIPINAEMHIAIIIGKGNLTVYDDIISKRVNVRRSEARFYEDSQWQILLAFENNEELIQLLKNYTRRESENE